MLSGAKRDMPIAQLKNEQDPAEVADEKCNRFTCDLILSAGIWLSIGTEESCPRRSELHQN